MEDRELLFSWLPFVIVETFIDILFLIIYSNLIPNDLYYCLVGIFIVDIMFLTSIILTRWDNIIINKIRYYVNIFNLNYYCLMMIIIFNTILHNKKYVFSGLYIYFVIRITFWLIFMVSLVIIIILILLASCITGRTELIRIITNTNTVVGLNLGLTTEQFAKLNHYIFKENSLTTDTNLKIKELDNEHTVCNICMLDYEDNTYITLLDCNHHFDRECIKKWLMLHNTCPICRNVVNVE